MEIQKKLDGKVSDDFMKDFADACSDRNYGQFIWSSSHCYAEQPGDSEVDDTMPNPILANGEVHQYQEVIYLDPESLESGSERSKEKKQEAPPKKKKEGEPLNQMMGKTAEKLTRKQPAPAPSKDSAPIDKDNAAEKEATAPTDKKKADVPHNTGSPSKTPVNGDNPKVKMFEFLLKNGFTADEVEEIWEVYPGLDAMKADKGKSVRRIQMNFFKHKTLLSKVEQIRNCIELL